jgi:DNA-binding NarL/FixJ family response regulator
VAELQEPPVGLARESVQALVVDAHPVARVGLSVLLHRQSWIARCLVATDLTEAVRLARQHRPDVAVVDISEVGPLTGGYLAPLRVARPTMQIVLSSFAVPAPDSQLVNGEGRLITSTQPVEEVLATIRAALLGDDRGVAGPGTRSDRGLSAREKEVLALLCTGATNREIAAALHVGPETVKKHARSLYRKLGARNRTEAARRAAELSAA